MIAGRENEPAGSVFKNVKLLKDVPAGEFLKNMDVNYGRGLGMGCGNCHVVGQYDGDTRKNKRVAREMQEMTDYINKVRLASIKELDEDYVKVTCVTCHMGSGHPKNTMPVPSLPGR
jgi:cytochrome c553